MLSIVLIVHFAMIIVNDFLTGIEHNSLWRRIMIRYGLIFISCLSILITLHLTGDKNNATISLFAIGFYFIIYVLVIGLTGMIIKQDTLLTLTSASLSLFLTAQLFRIMHWIWQEELKMASIVTSCLTVIFFIIQKIRKQRNTHH